jgi:very-short-patch-repair endonuclease
MNSHYNKIIKPLARELRNSSTFGEVYFMVKGIARKQMLGYQFNRQFTMKISLLQSN